MEEADMIDGIQIRCPLVLKRRVQAHIARLRVGASMTGYIIGLIERDLEAHEAGQARELREAMGGQG